MTLFSWAFKKEGQESQSEEKVETEASAETGATSSSYKTFEWKC